jgi:hypothetical protein
MPGPLRPFGERAQAGPELLAAGAPLDLEVALLGLAAIMGEAEKGEFLGLLPASTRVLAGKPAKLQAAGLLLRQ